MIVVLTGPAMQVVAAVLTQKLPSASSLRQAQGEQGRAGEEAGPLVSVNLRREVRTKSETKYTGPSSPGHWSDIGPEHYEAVSSSEMVEVVDVEINVPNLAAAKEYIRAATKAVRGGVQIEEVPMAEVVE
jgi:hypothetical protein